MNISTLQTVVRQALGAIAAAAAIAAALKLIGVMQIRPSITDLTYLAVACAAAAMAMR